MRPALALAAALPLALGACKVDVEGAPCGAPGTTGDCPSGQACGNDGRCSERAAACTASRCTPGETRCAGVDAKERAETCTDADPACGAWSATGCTAQGLECGTRSGAATCECPAFSGAELAADPIAGSISGASPFPTGAAAPAGCRFRRLGDALASAGALAASGPVTVRAYATPAQALVVFGDVATGDGPIAIPPGVTVAGAAGATTLLRFEAATAAPLVALEGQLGAFRIEAVAATGPAVLAGCGSSGAPALADVAVDGGGALTTGVEVSGTCGAQLSGVTVARVAGPALRVDADPAAQVTIQGGALRDSDVGARIAGGKVTFGVDGDPTRSVEVTGNAHEGVLLSPGATIDARLYGARIHGNAGTGLVVEPVTASAVSLLACDVFSNGGGAPRGYGPGGGRSVGGVLVAQNGISLALWGNRVYANAADQLAFESSAAWSIAPSACGAASNLFACVATGSYAVAVAGGGTVDAANTVWPAVPFASYVSAGVTAAPTSYCNTLAGVPATPACPVP
ncbi:MAG TPA: hypothetical protein VF841_04170 [Anaeromyxobacter sp.]